MNRNETTLELNKVLEMLAEYAACPDTKKLAMELHPSHNRKEVLRKLQETGDAQMLLARFGAPSFGSVKNIQNAVRRAEAGASLSMRELLDIAEVLRTFRAVHDWHAHCEGVESSLDDIFFGIQPNKHLEEKITTSILSEDTVADTASSELASIRRKIRSASSRIREHLDSLIRSATYQKALQEPIVTLREGRFVVPVKIEHRNEIPGLVHGSSSSGSTVFIEPMAAVEANNEIRLLANKEAEEIDRILCALSAEAGECAGSISAGYALLLDLDLAFAKGKMAYDMKAATPFVPEDFHLVLRHARHPLLPRNKAVPIDVELGGEFDTLVITGPNTGGKTVSLKTIGLLSLMVSCGLFPPVDSGSFLPLYDEILVDIGDEQSIEQSLSTFSSHIVNLIDILKVANERSLVLVDELGAGTDPVEGAALAIAILEKLHSQGSHIVATTHYAELKAYAVHTDRVENGSCEFDVESLRPTYRLLVGVPGRSNAFAISERLGMDVSLVNRARDLVDGDDRKMEDVVVRLEEKRHSLEEALRIAEESKTDAERKAKDARQKAEALKEEQEKALEEAKAKAKRIVEQARFDADALMDEMRNIRKNKHQSTAKTNELMAGVKKKLNEMDETFDPVRQVMEQEDYQLPRPLKAGDSIVIRDLGQTGTVLKTADKNGLVEIQAGAIHTRIAESSLRLLEDEKRPVKSAVRSRTIPKETTGDSKTLHRSRDAKTELDIRGYAVDEALPEIDRFLDTATLSNFHQITIIHGKGTGVLRTAVQKHLRSHKQVKTFRYGVYGEGENGVTIVELK